jgi:pimeloyl-ACP methyl ester carboxylesterase
MEWMQYANSSIRQVMKLRGVKSQVAELSTCRMHYYHLHGTGRAPPLLLLHGLGSSANAFFRSMFPLSKIFQEVWAVDLPGNGFSPRPPGGYLPIRAQVDAVLEFRKTVIGQKVVLTGNSLGGAMAMYAAAQEPESFSGLCLISPAGAQLEAHRMESLLKSFSVNNTADARVFANKLFAQPSLGILLFADELRKMVSSPTVKAFVSEIKAEDALTPEMLAKFSMPTFLIWGTKEKLLPYESIEFFRKHLPKHAQVFEVEGFGHMPQIEHVKEFVAKMTDFAASILGEAPVPL